MHMKQLKKVINSPWVRSAAIGLIGVAMIYEGHVFYSGIAFGFATREFLLMLKPTCETCKK